MKITKLGTKIRYRMCVMYDGTNYSGWQIQPNAETLQGAIERAMNRVIGGEIRLFSSGRTDSGVHARKQVCHFDLNRVIDVSGIQKGINALLPDDIRAWGLCRTKSSFDARKDVVQKEYRYFISNTDVLAPFDVRYRTHIRHRLDIDLMRNAARMLQGKHDFAAFSANSRREIGSTVRTIFSLSVERREHDIVIIARGDGFLYRMVRSIAGLLIRVGEGRLSAESVGSILRSKTRTTVVPTAPARGLFLWNVTY